MAKEIKTGEEDSPQMSSREHKMNNVFKNSRESTVTFVSVSRDGKLNKQCDPLNCNVTTNTKVKTSHRNQFTFVNEDASEVKLPESKF